MWTPQYEGNEVNETLKILDPKVLLPVATVNDSILFF